LKIEATSLSLLWVLKKCEPIRQMLGFFYQIRWNRRVVFNWMVLTFTIVICGQRSKVNTVLLYLQHAFSSIRVEFLMNFCNNLSLHSIMSLKTRPTFIKYKPRKWISKKNNCCKNVLVKRKESFVNSFLIPLAHRRLDMSMKIRSKWMIGKIKN
jgi:hypothetical protein